jgi:hypothetical protein
MILPWMVYAALLASLISLAAASLETIGRRRALPMRGLTAFSFATG